MPALGHANERRSPPVAFRRTQRHRPNNSAYDLAMNVGNSEVILCPSYIINNRTDTVDAAQSSLSHCGIIRSDSDKQTTRAPPTRSPRRWINIQNLRAAFPTPWKSKGKWLWPDG